jgi:hypothetical protein
MRITNAHMNMRAHILKQWVDEDGDHVTISSDVELKEAFAGSAANGGRCFLVTLPGMDSESIEKLLTSTTDGEEWVLVKPEDCEPQTDTPPGPAAALANEDASMSERGAQTTPEHPKDERAEACQRRDSSSLKRRSPALQTKMADAGVCVCLCLWSVNMRIVTRTCTHVRIHSCTYVLHVWVDRQFSAVRMRCKDPGYAFLFGGKYG